MLLLLPGLGYRVIDERVARLQPWSYLLQLAEGLAAEGHRVTVMPFGAQLGKRVAERLAAHGVAVTTYSRTRLSSTDVLLMPIAVGFLKRVAGLLSANTRLIGVLTTPLAQLRVLAANYPRIKLSRTSITLDSVVRENILFRLAARTICKRVEAMIVPSADYEQLLTAILPCEMRIVRITPKVDVTGPRDACDKRSAGQGEHQVITYFGPFTEERGVVSLVKAFRRLSGDKHVLRLLLRKGKGRDSVPTSLARIRGPRIQVRIGFLSRKELIDTLCTSSIVALPYRILSSVVPLAFLEALMLRGPIVLSTSIPGIAEHTRHYLVGVELSPTYTVGKLRRILHIVAEEKHRVIAAKQEEYAAKLTSIIASTWRKISID